MSRPNPTEYWNPRIEPARGPRYVVVVDTDAEVVAAVSDAARRDRTAVFEVVVDVGDADARGWFADSPSNVVPTVAAYTPAGWAEAVAWMSGFSTAVRQIRVWPTGDVDEWAGIADSPGVAGLAVVIGSGRERPPFVPDGETVEFLIDVLQRVGVAVRVEDAPVCVVCRALHRGGLHDRCRCGAVRSSVVAADYPDVRIGDDPVGPIADWPAGIW